MAANSQGWSITFNFWLRNMCDITVHTKSNTINSFLVLCFNYIQRRPLCINPRWQPSLFWVFTFCVIRHMLNYDCLIMIEVDHTIIFHIICRISHDSVKIPRLHAVSSFICFHNISKTYESICFNYTVY